MENKAKYIIKINYNGKPGYAVVLRDKTTGKQVRRYSKTFEEALQKREELLAALGKGEGMNGKDFYPHNLISTLGLYDTEETIDLEYVVSHFDENLNYLYSLYPSVFSERDKDFIKMKFVDLEYAATIGEKYNVCRERARQILEAVISRLKSRKFLRVLLYGKDIIEQEKASSRDKYASSFGLGLDELDLSARSHNGLLRNGFDTVDKVIKVVETGEIYKLKHIGTICSDEIVSKVKAYMGE